MLRVEDLGIEITHDGRGHGGDTCFFCGRDVKTTIRAGQRFWWVHVHGGGAIILLDGEDPKQYQYDESAELGLQRVGSECIKRIPMEYRWFAGPGEDPKPLSKPPEELSIQIVEPAPVIDPILVDDVRRHGEALIEAARTWKIYDPEVELIARMVDAITGLPGSPVATTPVQANPNPTRPGRRKDIVLDILEKALARIRYELDRKDDQ